MLNQAIVEIEQICMHDCSLANDNGHNRNEVVPFTSVQANREFEGSNVHKLIL